MLIDVHAHFFHPASPRADGEARNASRLRAGAAIGITTHAASVLGSWGATSPTYFPSSRDTTEANRWMREFADRHGALVRGYVVVNPNFPDHAAEEIRRGLAGGMIGVKLAASRRADDPLVDPVADAAGAAGVPVLHHIWQHRRTEWPGQEASDAAELAVLARRHPSTNFILAHLGGGGDWSHTLRAIRRVSNIYVDLSGSGVDGGMVEAALHAAGADRLLWGCDITMDTGWAKLRRLEVLLAASDLDAVRAGNACRIFPAGAFEPAAESPPAGRRGAGQRG